MYYQEDLEFFEKEFNAGEEASCGRTSRERIDNIQRGRGYGRVYIPPSPEREARIVAHQKRVQKDLKELAVI